MTWEETQERLRLARLPKPKKEKKPLRRVSVKQAAKDAAEKEERGGEDTQLQKWFAARIKQLTGKCLRCGEKYNHKYTPHAIAACAHVLPKRGNMFPSVMYHMENCIELSQTCGCHNWYDNFASWEEIVSSPIWPIVLEKFKIIEPHIKERDKIPEVFLQEIKPKV